MLKKKYEIIAGLSQDIIRLCNIAQKHNDKTYDYEYMKMQAKFFIERCEKDEIQ